MAVVKTIKVVSDQTKYGYMIINKEDFTNKHELYKEKVKIVAKNKEGFKQINEADLTDKDVIYVKEEKKDE